MGGITGREGRFTPADCRLRVFNRSGDKPPFLTCDPSIFQAEIELLLPDRALAPLSFYVKEAPRCSLPVRRSKDEKTVSTDGRVIGDRGTHKSSVRSAAGHCPSKEPARPAAAIQRNHHRARSDDDRRGFDA